MSSLWRADYATAVLCVIICILVLSSYVPRWWMSLKYRRLPPGPFCWPLIGFVPAFSLEAICRRLQEVSVKFGGIFGFYVGSRYVVFIDDFQALKTAFGREEFLARSPRMLNFSLEKQGTGVVNANGQEWKELKRFWQNSIRTIGPNSQAFRSEMQSQISLLAKELEDKEGKDVDLHWTLEHRFFNLGFFLTYGKTVERGNPMLGLVHDYNRAVLIVLGVSVLNTLFTWFGKILCLLPKNFWSRKMSERLELLLSNEVKQHKQRLDPNDSRDFVDLFLLQMQKPGMEHIYSEDSLLVNSLEAMLGFTISLCTHMQWFLLSMAAQPDTQSAIQVEIDYLVGREREPLLSDRPLLFLLDAAIMESTRFRHFVTLAGYRNVQKDTSLNGYAIPKDTLVFYNATFHFRNPKYWRDPERFDHKRFLSPDESSLRVPEYFIPYGVGKRTSVGESSSGPVMFLFAASLLQRFRILPPDGGINLDIDYGMINKPVYPFVKFQNRF